MIIRDAVEADLPAIVEIYNATVPTRMVTAELEPTTVEARLPWFREHSSEHYPFWVAESDGRVIAWLDFKRFLARCAYRGTAEISVYVDEEFRRRGVGQRLLEQAIARAPSLGITALVGLIFGHNEPSLKLFQHLGFERWGFFPGVSATRWRPARSRGDGLNIVHRSPRRSRNRWCCRQSVISLAIARA